jgi:hypothetical protein
MEAQALLGEFIPIFVIAVMAIVLYKFFEGRHRERMLMIEKGVTPADFKGGLMTASHVNPLANLKWSLLAIFVGIGLLVANIVYRRDIMDGTAYPMFMLIFGGIGLLVFYLDAKRVIKKEEEERRRQLHDMSLGDDK